jgi:hypothetical protein
MPSSPSSGEEYAIRVKRKAEADHLRKLEIIKELSVEIVGLKIIL